MLTKTLWGSEPLCGPRTFTRLALPSEARQGVIQPHRPVRTASDSLRNAPQPTLYSNQERSRWDPFYGHTNRGPRSDPWPGSHPHIDAPSFTSPVDPNLQVGAFCQQSTPGRSWLGRLPLTNTGKAFLSSRTLSLLIRSVHHACTKRWRMLRTGGPGAYAQVDHSDVWITLPPPLPFTSCRVGPVAHHEYHEYRQMRSCFAEPCPSLISGCVHTGNATTTCVRKEKRWRMSPLDTPWTRPMPIPNSTTRMSTSYFRLPYPSLALPLEWLWS
jgi:hypothetical protein